jgi:beta-mannanase
MQADTKVRGDNRLTRLTFRSVTNGRVELNGSGVAVPSSVALTTTDATFALFAVNPTDGFLLQFSVADLNGDVQKFVGYGNGGGTKSAPTATPSPTPSPVPTSSATATPMTSPTGTVSPTAIPSPTTSPTTVPASGQVAFGTYRYVFPNDLSSVAAYEQATGKQMTIVHWYALWGGWKAEFSRADLDLVDRRGSVPMITWEPWAGTPNDPAWSLRAAILSGQHDAYIESWARGMAAYGKPVLLRFAHEMHHQPTYPWALGNLGNTADEYVAAWRHVRAIFDRHGATNVAWVWNPNTMGDTSATTYAPIYRALYPGDAYVDWVGLDLYNTGPRLNWGAPYWRSLAAVLSQPYAAIMAVANKPLILGEVGSAETGGDKAQWISEGLGPSLVAQFPRVKAVVWFDMNKEEAWAVSSSSSAQSAYVSALRQSQYMASASQLMPVLARRQPAEPSSDLLARTSGVAEQ